MTKTTKTSAVDFRRLLRQLDHEQDQIRVRAARRVRELLDLRAVPALIDSLSSGGPNAKAQSEMALSSLGSEVVAPLCEAFSAGDSRLRFHLACVLSQLGDVRAIEPLIAALNEPEPSISAAEALGAFKVRAAVEALAAGWLFEHQTLLASELREWIDGRRNHGWTDNAWVVPLERLVKRHD